ncbi:cadherin-like domain-containing protein [Vibrio chagasii]|nr:cadherin-like domain-containing protein [Vibrio chagasii]
MGDNLSVENVASDSGSLVDNGDGTYTFAPNENFDANAVNVTFDTAMTVKATALVKNTERSTLWLICQSCRLRSTG